MNDNKTPSLDAIFWVGNSHGAAVVNYTNGKTYALITQRGGLYDIRLFFRWFQRLRFWRRLKEVEHGKIAGAMLCYMEVEFESMLEAITETDRILEALDILPLRVEPWERYYLLRPIVEERE